MIFSAPKAQWGQVLKRLQISAKNVDDIFIEKMVSPSDSRTRYIPFLVTLNLSTCFDIAEEQELLLLGCLTSSRWTRVIEGVMSVSYKSITVSEQYEELCKLLLQRSKSLKQSEIALNSKVTFLSCNHNNVCYYYWKPNF